MTCSAVAKMAKDDDGGDAIMHLSRVQLERTAGECVISCGVVFLFCFFSDYFVFCFFVLFCANGRRRQKADVNRDVGEGGEQDEGWKELFRVPSNKRWY